MCALVLQQFNEQKETGERLKIENEVLCISIKDLTTSKETVIKELRRLLEKETSLVNVLNAELAPDPNGMYPSCAWCMHHRQQARSVREANAQEYRWVVHFAKLSQNLRLELEDALLKEKTKHSHLQCAYDELHLRKTDPLARDGEIARLRAEAVEAKRQQSNSNQTALMANKVTETLRKELMQVQQRVTELEILANERGIRVVALEEAMDACRRSEELQGCAVGECKDYVCKRRAMDLMTREKELRAQIEGMHRERVHHLGMISKMRQDSEQWKNMMGGQQQAEECGAKRKQEDEEENMAGEDKEENNSCEEDYTPPVRKKAALSSKAQLVANLTNMVDLTMNLRSLFQIFPAWQSETLDEEEMLRDFVADTEPVERVENLQWILEACGMSSADILPKGKGVVIGEEWKQIASSKITRRCFAACMRTLGGIARKAGTRIVWINVKRTRKPIFMEW